MGNYVDGCSKDGGCRRSTDDFRDAATFGKRRTDVRLTKAKSGPLNSTKNNSPKI